MNLEEQEYTKQFDLNLWKKIIRFVMPHKKHFLMLAMFAILLAVGDSIFPLMTKYAIDNFITGNNTEKLPLFIVMYLALIVYQINNIYRFIYISGRLERNIVYDIRKEGFNKLQELSFSYYDNTHVGWIMARMTSDAQKIGDIIAWGSLDFIWGFALIFIVIFNMLMLNVKLALITLSVFPFLAVVSVFFQKRILANHREVRKINSKITGAYNEGINGARTTKTLIREEKNFDEFKELSSSMKKASVRAALYSAVYMPIVLSLGSIGVGLVLWSGGNQVLLGAVGLGTLSVFVSYAQQVFDPIRQIAQVLSEFQSAQASAERTLTLLETESDIKDREDVLERYGDALNPKKENWPSIKGDIEFKHVNFSYKTGEKVLEDFNLTIRAGEKIALVGETGAGKSTIVNLICRFYEPTAGELLIDGVDYRERSQIWLQSNLGYVLQTPHLFSGTIMENIRYAKLDATDDEVIAAAKTVNAYDFIMKLEKGFATDVGEGGNRLSSGQKQLVSFARAILADPRIFVLDEATSSIDTETEAIMQKAVYKVLEGRTSFIVAHRLSTIRFCDKILVIKDGGILESGNHKQLLKQRGYYYNLYTNQFKREAESRLLAQAEKTAEQRTV